MNKNVLIKEYEDEGLTIIDFHLGLRLAQPIFLNTIVAAFIFLSYLVFFYALYMMSITDESNYKINIGIFAILVILLARYIAKFLAYTFVLLCFALLSIVILNIDHQGSLDFILKSTLTVTILCGLLLMALISTIVVYRTNRNIVIKDGVLSIPASDVEQSIFAYIILKPFWGLFYRRNILLEEIVSVKNDGYGSKTKDIYPITVTDVNASNRLVFTSRQKRDEFKTKISILLGLRDSSGSSFGESE